MKSPWMNLARILFVIAVIWFGWMTLQDIWPDVQSVLDDISTLQTATSLLLVLTGLVATGVVWKLFLNGFGYHLHWLPAFNIFFIGQLGKYLPGSLWILGAQGQMARKHEIPVRVTMSTGVVFLYWNVITAIVVCALLSLFGAINIEISYWLSWILFFVSLIGLLPYLLNIIARRLTALKDMHGVSWARMLILFALMCLAWISFGSALLRLTPNIDNLRGSLSLSICVAVYSLAYLAGVLVPFAPAGFGVREATMISLLAPNLGVASATTVALLLRVIHMIGDFGLALTAWLMGLAVQSSEKR